jgi:hypothetical protein
MTRAFVKENATNLTIGAIGTLAAKFLSHEFAATVAGFATAFWMLTQSFILLFRQFKTQPKPKSDHEEVRQNPPE